MYVAYSKKRQLAVYFEDIESSEPFCTPIGDREGFQIRIALSDLEVYGKIQPCESPKTGKCQPSANEMPGKCQSGASEVPAKCQADASEMQGRCQPDANKKTSQKNEKSKQTEKARESLPSAKPLEEELEEKWSILRILFRDDTYSKSETVSDFESLVKMFSSNQLQNVPRPALDTINSELGTKHSRAVPNRAVSLYVEYQKKNPVKPFEGAVFWLYRKLNGLERMLDYIIFKL